MLNLCSLASKPKCSGAPAGWARTVLLPATWGGCRDTQGLGGSTGLPGDSLGHGCQRLGLSSEEVSTRMAGMPDPGALAEVRVQAARRREAWKSGSCLRGGDSDRSGLQAGRVSDSEPFRSAPEEPWGFIAITTPSYCPLWGPGCTADPSSAATRASP